MNKLKRVKGIGNGLHVVWSQKDIDIVKNNYLEMKISDIIPLLSRKRTHKAVLHIAAKLGLRRQVFVENFKELKYKLIDNVIHKLCKKCNRYLPLEKLYFPYDKTCTDKHRNVCKECKGENFHNSNKYYWTDEEIKILKENYVDSTNLELKTKYFPNLSPTQMKYQASLFGLMKSKDAIERAHKDSLTDEWKEKISLARIKEDKWKGNNNPQHDSQRFGELNPNYKGGLSQLYEELRRNLKQWKVDSMDQCNYKCVISGERFDAIHHLYSFNSIVNDTFEELQLPMLENISMYTNEELRRIVDKCIEIHYRHPLGVCLTNEYHQEYHMRFGYGDNTPDEFNQFINELYGKNFQSTKETS